MFNQFEDKYMNLHYQLKQQQWNNYSTNKTYDLSLIDDQIYELVKHYYGKMDYNTREHQIINQLIDRQLVEKHPDVAKLRNKLDDFSNYSQGLSKDDLIHYKINLANRVKPDVLLLMNKRNELATNIGYGSYIDLVFKTEELDFKSVKNHLQLYINQNLTKAKHIIKKYKLSFLTWFSDLDRFDHLNNTYHPEEQINNLFQKLGFNHLKSTIDIHYTKNDNVNGYATEVSPGQLKVIAPPIKSLYPLGILYHELGHACSMSLNNQKGICKILPASYDEVMAVVMEYLAPTILLSKEEQEILDEIRTVEYTRCAISSLFEFELWSNIHNAETIYQKHYEQLELTIDNPELWSLDSFRSIDPVYIQNYVLGAIIAPKLINHLNHIYKQDYHQYGQWLNEYFYHDGTKQPFKEKLLQALNISL